MYDQCYWNTVELWSKNVGYRPHWSRPPRELLRFASLADNRPMSAVLQANVAADRKTFYDRIDKAHVAPLWEVLHAIITPTPNTPCKPHLWKWDQMWPWIQEAGRLITAKEAERRVLVLENPGLRGRSSITHSL